jgi:hypothetical protein
MIYQPIGKLSGNILFLNQMFLFCEGGNVLMPEGVRGDLGACFFLKPFHNLMNPAGRDSPPDFSKISPSLLPSKSNFDKFPSLSYTKEYFTTGHFLSGWSLELGDWRD